MQQLTKKDRHSREFGDMQGFYICSPKRTPPLIYVQLASTIAWKLPPVNWPKDFNTKAKLTGMELMAPSKNSAPALHVPLERYRTSNMAALNCVCRYAAKRLKRGLIVASFHFCGGCLRTCFLTCEIDAQAPCHSCGNRCKLTSSKPHVDAFGIFDGHLDLLCERLPMR